MIFLYFMDGKEDQLFNENQMNQENVYILNICSSSLITVSLSQTYMSISSSFMLNICFRSSGPQTTCQQMDCRINHSPKLEPRCGRVSYPLPSLKPQLSFSTCHIFSVWVKNQQQVILSPTGIIALSDPNVIDPNITSSLALNNPLSQAEIPIPP